MPDHFPNGHASFFGNRWWLGASPNSGVRGGSASWEAWFLVWRTRFAGGILTERQGNERGDPVRTRFRTPPCAWTARSGHEYKSAIYSLCFIQALR